MLSLGVVSADENMTTHNMPLSDLGENAIQTDASNNNKLVSEDFANTQNDVSNNSHIKYVEGNTFKDIQDAINSASENDTLILNGTYIGNGQHIVVNKSITITSENNNGIIDANKTNRCLYISANNVILKNISITNGLRDWNMQVPAFSENRIEGDTLDAGSAIYWAGNNGQLINCKVHDNLHAHDGHEGNCVYWEGLNGSIINSSFYSNYYYNMIDGIKTEYPIVSGFIHGHYEGNIWQDCYFDNVTINAKSKLTFNKIVVYNDKISFKIVNENNIPYINDSIKIHIYNNGYDCIFNAKTDENGFSSITLPSNLTVGKYNIEFYAKVLKGRTYGGLPPNEILLDEYYANESIMNSSISVVKSTAILKSSNLILRFDYSNPYFTVKLLDNKNNPIKDSKIKINIYNKNKLIKTYYITTNSQGIAKLPFLLYVGNYKLHIYSLNKNYNTKEITKIIRITKAPTIIKTQSIVKKNKAFKIQILNTIKNPIQNILLKIKVFTGKTYKIYNAKTNSKGFAILNAKNLKIGNHKIQITTTNPNWQINKKTTLKITK